MSSHRTNVGAKLGGKSSGLLCWTHSSWSNDEKLKRRLFVWLETLVAWDWALGTAEIKTTVLLPGFCVKNSLFCCITIILPLQTVSKSDQDSWCATARHLNFRLEWLNDDTIYLSSFSGMPSVLPRTNGRHHPTEGKVIACWYCELQRQSSPNLQRITSALSWTAKSKNLGNTREEYNHIDSCIQCHILVSNSFSKCHASVLNFHSNHQWELFFQNLSSKLHT
jgi:hypothetical protein